MDQVGEWFFQRTKHFAKICKKIQSHFEKIFAKFRENVKWENISRKFYENHEFQSCNNWLLKRTCGILCFDSSIFEVFDVNFSAKFSNFLLRENFLFDWETDLSAISRKKANIWCENEANGRRIKKFCEIFAKQFLVSAGNPKSDREVCRRKYNP